MAWRFKASKYKNAAPKFPKKEEWISEVSTRDLGQSCGNHIAASCAYMAFNIDSGGGGKLAILPLTASGKYGPNLPVLHAHGDFVSDFSFSQFDDFLLATGSHDHRVSIWNLPDEDMMEGQINLLEASTTLPQQESRIENVLWNPIAENVLAISTSNVVKIFDVEECREKCVLNDHKDQVQSISWKGDGSIIASSCKDKTLRIFDPRSQKVVQEGCGPQNIKDSRAYWLGNKDQLLSSGFDTSRSREVKLFDTRNLKSALHSMSFGTSTGVMMPLFDEDTNMLFLIGKGDTSINYLEVSESSPYLTENSVVRTEQTKGAGLVPKRALDVMEGEVDRLLLLTSSNTVLSVPVIVPRKTYRDFHDDLFPPTSSGDPVLSAANWFSGENGQVKTISLNPDKRENVVPKRGKLLKEGGEKAERSRQSPSPSSAVSVDSGISSVRSTPERSTEGEKSNIAKDSKPKPAITSKKPAIDNNRTREKEASTGNTEDIVGNSNQQQRNQKKFTGVRQSKFRHLKGRTLHKSSHIDNVKVNKTVPGECDVFHANQHRCAYPLEGPGGLVSVLELDKPCRLPNSGVPVIQNGSKVCDFAWDPFDDTRLIVACDDAKIRVWEIPEGGLVEMMTEPEFYLRGHTEKIYFIKFHPIAENVLVSASYDMTVRLWDLIECTEQISIEHPDQVFCAGWSPCGQKLATICKDGLIRVFDPRQSTEPLDQGSAPGGSRGARLVWVLDGQYLFVSGFDRMSNRLLTMYKVTDLGSRVATEEIDASPMILVPYYDENSNTIFLHARGESLVYTFEVSDEAPHLFQLSHHKAEGLHQSLSFMPKFLCDVRNIEFAKAWRLTNSTIEPISFTVPRVKTEYFQDDLFPDARITWRPYLTSSQWFSGMNAETKTMSLKPSDMKLLSEAPIAAPKPKKYESYDEATFKTDNQKKEELMSAMVNKLGLKETPLPQDLEEGVDSDEWDD